MFYFIKNHISFYASSYGMNYNNVIGFLLIITFIIQFLSGLLLSLYYIDYVLFCFDSVIYIGINVNNGFIIRLLHVICASLLMFLLYLHLLRYLFISIKSSSFEFSQMKKSNYVKWSGFIIYFFFFFECFLGYCLPFGNMSFWGVTVILNILSVISIIGPILIKFIWCSSYVIINRIFIIHYAIGFLIILFIILHLILLHNLSSSSPFININSSLLIPFIILLFKDYFFLLFIFYYFIFLLFIEPDILGNKNNNILANSLVTPLNIIPEWYFLILYSILRAIPIKFIGAILIIIFFVLCFIL